MFRRRSLAAAPLALLLLPHAAGAQSVPQVLGEFGLLGSWSADCSKPASPEAPRVVYAVEADGSVTRELVEGAAHGTGTPFVAATRVAPDQVEVDYLYQDRTVHLVLEMREGRHHGLTSWIDGGAPFMEDGVVLANNRRAPWLTKCKE
ncbi:MAG: hypothetical protein ACLQJR_33450 [Stellaceae bacterium]